MTQDKHQKYEGLIARCKALPPTPCAVAHPCDESSLRGAVEAGQMGLLRPILVGPKARIEAVAAQFNIDLSGCELVDAPHSVGSAETAVQLAREGRAEMLMKGSLHTDELMAAVVKRDTGLRTGRRISHCFIMDVPAIDRVVIITDAAINIFPTLEDKVHIVQNAIDMVRALGLEQPKVAIRRCRPPSRPLRCARWLSVVRSPAPCSTGRWRWTTPSISRRPRSRKSRRPWADRPTFWWCPTWRPATCWPRA
jgi:phosphate acetyltransferase